MVHKVVLWGALLLTETFRCSNSSLEGPELLFLECFQMVAQINQDMSLP